MVIYYCSQDILTRVNGDCVLYQIKLFSTGETTSVYLRTKQKRQSNTRGNIKLIFKKTLYCNKWHSADVCTERYRKYIIGCLKGKFSSGIEGALASTLNHDYNWKQLSDMIICIFLLMFSKFI